MNELLPIGSIVYLNKSKRKIMIIGFLPQENCTKDYIGIFLNKNNSKVTFNHQEIRDILFIGYQTRSSINYQNIIKTTKEKLIETKSELLTILEVRKKYLQSLKKTSIKN